MIKRWTQTTRRVSFNEYPESVQEIMDNSEPLPRTVIYASAGMMEELGLDYNNPDQRFALPDQCCREVVKKDPCGCEDMNE